MKVLFHAYNTFCQTESGGVQVRVRKIKSLLESKGIQVDFFNPSESNLRDYDVLHVFSLQIETLDLIHCAKSLGLRVVLSAIVNIDKGFSIRTSLLISPFLRRIKVSTVEAQKAWLLKFCDCIIVETPAEGRFISYYYHVSDDRIRVVPNGADKMERAGDEIYNLIGKKVPYALVVGRIDPNKNQLNLIKAFSKTNYDLVIVGGPYAVGESTYFERCMEIAQNNQKIHYLGWLKHGSRELLSAYQCAQALFVPSFQETFGLVCVEGAMAGTNVCLSKTLPILEFGIFDNELTYAPSKLTEITAVINRAMTIPKNLETQEKAESIFCWDSIVEEHIKIYNS